MPPKETSTLTTNVGFHVNFRGVPSGKLIYSNGKWTRIEDVFPIENGNFPLLC